MVVALMVVMVVVVQAVVEKQEPDEEKEDDEEEEEGEKEDEVALAKGVRCLVRLTCFHLASASFQTTFKMCSYCLSFIETYWPVGRQSCGNF